MRKCVLPLLLCAVLLCGCGGEKSLTVQVRPATTAPSP